VSIFAEARANVFEDAVSGSNGADEGPPTRRDTKSVPVALDEAILVCLNQRPRFFK
jgi:hypothetical protein